MRVRLTVTEGPQQGQEFVFAEHDLFLVGRSKSAHLRLPDKDAESSRLHFLVEVNPPNSRLVDLGSHSGTFVNGKKVGIVDLADGDLIQGGNAALRLSVESPGPLPATARHRTLSLSTRKSSAAKSGQLHSRARLLTAGDHCLACETSLPKTLARPSWLCPTCRERMDRNPQPFRGYRVVKELGQGNLGMVWLAMRSSDEQPVALKSIIAAAGGSHDDIDRFLREARVLQHLDHPHIVSFLEVGEVDGEIFLATDYIRGTDAAKLVKMQGPLPVKRAVTLTCQLLEALEYGQEHGFVHRDLKPRNVLISANGQSPSQDVVQVTDFGLGRLYQSSPLSGLTIVSRSDIPKSASQTDAHSRESGYAFMAPERFTAFRECKPPVDQYSAGAILYYLLTGKYGYDFPSQPTEQLLMVLLEDPVPILHRQSNLPSGLAEIIHRSLARDPKNRFSDVWTMRAALAEFQN